MDKQFQGSAARGDAFYIGYALAPSSQFQSTGLLALAIYLLGNSVLDE